MLQLGRVVSASNIVDTRENLGGLIAAVWHKVTRVVMVDDNFEAKTLSM